MNPTHSNSQKSTRSLDQLGAQLRQKLRGAGDSLSGAGSALNFVREQRLREKQALDIIAMLAELETHPAIVSYREYLRTNRINSHINLLPESMHIKGGGGLVLTKDGFQIARIFKYDSSFSDPTPDAILQLLSNFRPEALSREVLLQGIGGLLKAAIGNSRD